MGTFELIPPGFIAVLVACFFGFETCYLGGRMLFGMLRGASR